MTDNLRDMVWAYVDVLNAHGIPLPPELKARDKREPDRKKKMTLEDKIAASTMRHFKRQEKKIEQSLEMRYPDRKAVRDVTDFLDDEEFWEDDDWEAELVLLLTQAAKNGVLIFQQEVLLGMDYTLINAEAAKWARKYAGELKGIIDDTTRKAVRNAVVTFIETPGFTIRDVVNLLPFNSERAMQVGVTEVTRSYAEGQRLAGLQMKEEFPDVRVTKTWYTNNDDRVCEICGPLEGTEVDIDESFGVESGEEGLAAPPAHINCRCWMSTRTRING